MAAFNGSMNQWINSLTPYAGFGKGSKTKKTVVVQFEIGAEKFGSRIAL